MTPQECAPGRALVVVAHPDDVDFGISATVAAWVEAGTEVAYCLVTDGDAGGFDPAVPRSEIGGIRRAEQTAAAAAVGVDKLLFLGHPDGRVEPTIALRRDISAAIREVRPDLVITHNPERNWKRIYTSHPDHMATGEATLAAVYPDARNPFAHPELAARGLEAHTVPEVWLMGATAPDVFLDITDTFEKKIEALLCHKSQFASSPAEFRERIEGFSKITASAGGFPEGRFGEAFRRVDTE